MKNKKNFLNKLTIISLLMLCALTFISFKVDKEGWENHPIDPSFTAGLENLPIDPESVENLPINLTAGLEDLPIDHEKLENFQINA